MNSGRIPNLMGNEGSLPSDLSMPPDVVPKTEFICPKSRLQVNGTWQFECKGNPKRHGNSRPSSGPVPGCVAINPFPVQAPSKLHKFRQARNPLFRSLVTSRGIPLPCQGLLAVQEVDEIQAIPSSPNRYLECCVGETVFVQTQTTSDQLEDEAPYSASMLGSWDEDDVLRVLALEQGFRAWPFHNQI